MNKAFASQADLEEKPVSFTRLSDNAYAYTAEGDPNTGISHALNARLVLLPANHIGNLGLLKQALTAARDA